MEAARLGVKSELQLPAYTAATATWDPNQVCELQHTSQQGWVPDPLDETRDQTCTLMDASRICFCCFTIGTPNSQFLLGIEHMPGIPLRFYMIILSR